MIDFTFLVKALNVCKKGAPDQYRYIKTEAVLSNALRNYRTPANDHLRRALRIAWISAATALWQHRLQAAKDFGRPDNLAIFERFDGRFKAAKTEVLKNACNLSDQSERYHTEIDDNLDTLMKELPNHLQGVEMSDELTNAFEATLVAVVGGAPSEIPPDLLSAAKRGVKFNNGKKRNFGQLFADEFARVLQDKDHYPEAAGSFGVVQAQATQQLVAAFQKEVLKEIQKIPSQTADVIRNELDNLKDGWLKDELDRLALNVGAEFGEVKEGLAALPEQVANEIEARGHRLDRSTVNRHSPTASRTIMFGIAPNTEQISFRRLSDHISRRTRRFSETSGIISLEWQFKWSVEEGIDGPYTEDSAWETLNGDVIGAVLIIGKELTKPIAPNLEFYDQLTHRGWTVEKGGAFEDIHDKVARDQLKKLENGVVPITWETRFLLECLFLRLPVQIICNLESEQHSLAVRKFLAFASKNGCFCNSAVDIDANSDWASGFVKSLPGIGKTQLPNPYRALDYYQIDDGASFVGRDRDTNRVLADITYSINKDESVVIGVTGPSGCGKSSFLRAGIAAQAKEELKLNMLDIRPTDFQDKDGVGINVLPVLTRRIADLFGVEAPPHIVDSNVHYNLLKTPFNTWLDSVFQLKGCVRHILCVDQFEEIIDDLSEGINANEWKLLIELLLKLNRDRKWPILFTLEDSRHSRFEALKSELDLNADEMIALKTDEAFYRSVIIKPFEKAGIILDPVIVDEFLGDIRQMESDVGTSSSPLPLLALKLERLFADLSPRAPRQTMQSTPTQFFNRLQVSRHDLMGKSLLLGAMIADLAETAWLEGGGDDDEEMEAIGYFLQPLIRMSVSKDGKDDRIVLKANGRRGYRNEQALDDAFRKYRLLVPASNGFRLVHESLIRRWPRANAWYQKHLDDLKMEAAFRVDALKWHADKCPVIKKVSKELMKRAAHVLSVHIREWSMSNRTWLDDESGVLYDYAIAQFSHSKTPLEPILKDQQNSLHIHLAASYGLNALIKKFLKLQPDAIDAERKKDKRTPLACAGWGHPETVKFLLEKGADVSKKDDKSFTALDSAVWGENIDILELLLSKVDVNDWSTGHANPLGGAAYRANIKIANMLEDVGFSHQTAGNEGWSPLHQAACISNAENFQYFWEKGDLKLRNMFGATPVHIAASNGNLEVLQLILSTADGAELLTDNKSAWGSPLNLAAFLSKDHVVQYLLPYIADINAMPDPEQSHQDYVGMTALQMALCHFLDKNILITEERKGRIYRTVNALLNAPELDVARRVKLPAYLSHVLDQPIGLNEGEEITAWEMASGMPDVQRLIAQHPKFPEELLDTLRAEDKVKRIALLKSDMFAAAKADDKLRFEQLLRSDLANNVGDLNHFHLIGEELTTTDELMLGNGWDGLLVSMIDSNQIEPWCEHTKYKGMLFWALKADSTELAALIRQSTPKPVPSAIAIAIISGIRFEPIASDQIADSDGNLLDSILSNLSAETAMIAMRYAARFGDVDLMEQILVRYPAADTSDEWGRAPFDIAPDVTRKEKGLPDFASDHASNMDDFAFPNPENWSSVDDLISMEDLDPPDDIIWDDGVEWMQKPLPFYPEARLLMAKHADWEPKNLFIYFLERDGDFYRLDGTSPPIHEFNAKKTLDLTGANAVLYLRFFCFFVRGDEGPFYVLDKRDANYRPTLPEEENARIDELFQLPRRWGETDEGSPRLSALIYYSNAVFWSDFVVHLSGMVQMIEDFPISADLPSKIDAPLKD